MNRFQRIAAALVLGVLSLCNDANAQAWQWAHGPTMTNTGGGWGARGMATAITPSGEVFSSYFFAAPITLAGQTYTPSNVVDGVLAHYDVNGNVVAVPLVGGCLIHD